MTWEKEPMKIVLKAALQQEMEAQHDCGVWLRPRKDIAEFSARDHANNRAGQALAQLKEHGHVRVVVSRPVINGYNGNSDGANYLAIEESGTFVGNLDMALGILQRYPTAVEEVPAGEASHAPGSKSELLAQNADLAARVAELEAASKGKKKSKPKTTEESEDKGRR
jgi:hypothetical protein